ncbi:MAG: ribonuclease E/G [Rhodospirillaceae bacterium]|nr:ribonuclease E/G [Rhodospirillaceae bacterium]
MSAPDTIVIARGPGETRFALLADERCLEVAHVRNIEAQPGDVFVGRIGEPMPGGGAVFVDIGVAPHGVLELKGKSFPAGAAVAVEVVTPARADKGHKLKLSRLAVPPGAQAGARIFAGPSPALQWWQRYRDAIAEIVVEPRAEAKAYRSLLGDDAPIDVHDGRASAFDHFGIEEEIEAALAPRVALPGGGALIIEPTAALTAIDVDAGAARMDAANREAVVEVARQIRLRNLAGVILADFIAGKDKRKLVSDLKAQLADDPAGPRLTGLTPSGLMEIVRPRLRPSLSELLAGSAEAAGYRALRLACRELAARRASKITLGVAPAVAALLNERLFLALDEARRMASGDIVVEARPALPVGQIDIGA